MKIKHVLLYLSISIIPCSLFYKLSEYKFIAITLIVNIIITKLLKDMNKKVDEQISTQETIPHLNLLKPLIENLNDGVMALSPSREILFQNVKLSRILSNNNTNFDSFSNLPKSLQSEIESFSSSLQKSMTKDFNYNNVSLSLSIIVPNSESGLIVILKDVTMDKKLANLKTQLVTNISHELKTPLTSIKGYSELLIDNSESLNSIEVKYLNKILNNSNKLISIYDSLLSLSSIENTSELTKTQMRLEDTTFDIFLKLKDQYSNFSATINFNLNHQIINVNSNLFETVILNILENSFKYSNQDLKINVSLQIEGHSFVIKFTDNGIGISKDKKNQIFQRFYRVNESRSDEVKGLGLGLSLVKNIIEKHNGSVQVGDVDNGTQIILIIPR